MPNSTPQMNKFNTDADKSPYFCHSHMQWMPHYSTERFHILFPNISPVCQRCKSVTGNLTHSFWSCTKLSMFQGFSEAHGESWERDAFTAVLGVTGSSTSANRYEQRSQRSSFLTDDSNTEASC